MNQVRTFTVITMLHVGARGNARLMTVQSSISTVWNGKA